MVFAARFKFVSGSRLPGDLHTRWQHVLLLLALGVCGCGPTMYLVEVSDAETELEHAEEGNAKAYAAYEYYVAASYISKAKEEASEGHYEDALHLATQAQVMAKKAKQRAGRPDAWEQSHESLR